MKTTFPLAFKETRSDQCECSLHDKQHFDKVKFMKHTKATWSFFLSFSLVFPFVSYFLFACTFLLVHYCMVSCKLNYRGGSRISKGGVDGRPAILEITHKTLGTRLPANLGIDSAHGLVSANVSLQISQ